MKDDTIPVNRDVSPDLSPKASLEVSVITDVGLVRDNNEDSVYADPQHRFFAVADGMGGHAAGEIASSMAVDGVKSQLENTPEVIAEFIADPSAATRKQVLTMLDELVRETHSTIFRRGQRETDKYQMGTTLDVLLLAKNECFVAHVGDSRTYLFRQKQVEQITTDHTFAQALINQGELTKEEAQMTLANTTLLNAMGVSEDIGVEWAHFRLFEGDRVLMCSDGLHDYFPQDSEILDFVSSGNNVDIALRQLVETAKTRGGHDNITGILFEVITGPKSEDHIEDMERTPSAEMDDSQRLETVSERTAISDEQKPNKDTLDLNENKLRQLTEDATQAPKG